MSLNVWAVGRKLWSDEAGTVVSAEAAVLTTLGVLGASASVETLTKSVNDELLDVAFAWRSFDQSFSVKERGNGRAQVAASRFEQAPVKKSHAELRRFHRDAENRLKERSMNSGPLRQE